MNVIDFQYSSFFRFLFFVLNVICFFFIKKHIFLAILGLIPRKCPKEPLAELFWELKT